MPNKISHDSETPAHGQQVISACAFIHHDFDGVKKLFLAKRAATKKFLPGMLELPGGHIDFGETLVDGLKRELREELHMDINIGDPFAAFAYENLVKGSHTVEVIYFAQFIGPIEKITLNPEDHSSCEWFSLEDAMKRQDEIIPVGHKITHQYEEDPEYAAILKGFELLGGKALRFGKDT